MNNLLSYCELVDVRINASDKDLTVHKSTFSQKIFISIIHLLNINTHKNIGVWIAASLND